MKSLRKIVPLLALLVAVTVRADTPPAQANVQQAAQFHKDIDADHRHVLHLQALTRKEKDVIKLTCVNDKLIQIKAQMDLADRAQADVDAGAPLATTGIADLEKAASAIKKLRGEADACAGALEMYKQESKAEVDRPEIPDDPTQGDPFNPETHVPEVEVPGFATPYR